MPNSMQPLFLARASYRKRRLRDGARLLPIFGSVLLILPLLWPQGAGGIVAHWWFVFLVWLGLICIAALLSRHLGEADNWGEGDLAADGKAPPLPRPHDAADGA